MDIAKPSQGITKRPTFAKSYLQRSHFIGRFLEAFDCLIEKGTVVPRSLDTRLFDILGFWNIYGQLIS